MKKIKKNIKWITLIVVMIIIVCFFAIKWSLNYDKNDDELLLDELELNEKVKEDNQEEVAIVSKVSVDIKGAVTNPGVYEIDADKRVIDVIKEAGGFTNNADTSMINLAKKVSNEMVVIIYTQEEVRKALEPDSITKIIDNQCVCPKVINDACLKQTNSSNNSVDNSNSSNNSNADVIVNINIASIDELLMLTGIGESKAQAIITYREEHGNFKKIEDIMNVSGIGESLYEKIKANITV